MLERPMWPLGLLEMKYMWGCYWPMWPQEMSDVESGADRCIGKPGIPQLLAVKKDYIIDRVFCIAVLCMFLVLFIFIIFIL